jgi:hypothetical protein
MLLKLLWGNLEILKLLAKLVIYIYLFWQMFKFKFLFFNLTIGGIEVEDVAHQWAQHVEKKCPREPKMLRLYFSEFNVSTFALRIQAAQESVKSFKDVMEVRDEDMVDRHGKSIPPPPGLVIALGDANASPHFLTASGLSTGLCFVILGDK